MKIAVLIVGDWRMGFDTYPYNSYFLEKDSNIQIDYFIYTYTRNNIRLHINDTNNQPYNKQLIYETLRESDKQNIIKLYNPKKIVFQEASSSYSPPVNATWYLFKKGVELVNEYEKETGTKYDYYLKIRPDILVLDNDFTLREQIKKLSEVSNNHIINYYQFHNDWKDRLTQETSHDVYILGNPEVMKTYSNISEYIEKYSSKVWTQYNWLFQNNIEYLDFRYDWFEKEFEPLIRVIRYSPKIGSYYPSDIDELITKKENLLKFHNIKEVLYSDKRNFVNFFV